MFGFDWNWELANRVWHALSILTVAALLGAALGLARPARSAADELQYEVTVPYHAHIQRLTRAIRDLGTVDGTSIARESKKYETVTP